MKPNKTLLSSVLAASSAASSTAGPLGAAFGYQGKLADGGQPATGIYDFVFTLCTSTTNQLPIYSGVLMEDVVMTVAVPATGVMKCYRLKQP